MIGAYTRFHELGWSRQETFPGLVSFAIADDASQANGSIQWSWSVPSTVREIINGIYAWAMRLHEWATCPVQDRLTPANITSRANCGRKR